MAVMIIANPSIAPTIGPISQLSFVGCLATVAAGGACVGAMGTAVTVNPPPSTIALPVWLQFEVAATELAEASV